MKRISAIGLSTKLLLLIILSGILSVLFFFLLWENIGNAWNLAKNYPPFYWDENALVEELRAKAPNYALPEYDHGKNSLGEMDDFFTSVDEYTQAAIYGKEDGLFRAGTFPDILSHVYSGSMLDNGLSLIEERFSAEYLGYQMYDMEFKNGTGTVILRSFRDILFIYPYLIFIFLLCMILFFAPILYYMNLKIRAILRLKEEILVMSSGDLTHTIPVLGRDEIGILSSELDNLRRAFSETIAKETESRQANQDLITAMSHDLRTPLTILKGYLEVLKLKRCRKEQEEAYLDRCLKKTDDIQEMTDKMFEYALVFDEKETIEPEKIPVSFLTGCLNDNLEFIQLAGFHCTNTHDLSDLKETNTHAFSDFEEMNTHVFSGFEETNTHALSDFEEACTLLGDKTMLKRIFNNLFSNILKYGDKSIPVTLELKFSQGLLSIFLCNGIRTDNADIASNGIGLKSVKKMMKLHNGTFCQQKNHDIYQITLAFPLQSDSRCHPVPSLRT